MITREENWVFAHGKNQEDSVKRLKDVSLSKKLNAPEWNCTYRRTWPGVVEMDRQIG